MATRPMFFPASVLPVLVGSAWGARAAGALDTSVAVLAIAATVLVQAAANVINDVFDDLSGTDAANAGRVYPYTGGSRFIQTGILDRVQMRRWGWGLLALAALAGLALAVLKGPVVILLGLGGALLGIAYSVTPLQLNARGLGELSVGIGFGILPVTGAAWLQTGDFGPETLLLSLPMACWVFNILLINEIPDMAADASAGKRTLPVRFGHRPAAALSAVANALAVAAVALLVSWDVLPPVGLVLPVAAAIAAVGIAVRLRAETPSRAVLGWAIKSTLAIHTAGGLWFVGLALM